MLTSSGSCSSANTSPRALPVTSNREMPATEVVKLYSIQPRRSVERRLPLPMAKTPPLAALLLKPAMLAEAVLAMLKSATKGLVR